MEGKGIRNRNRFLLPSVVLCCSRSRRHNVSIFSPIWGYVLSIPFTPMIIIRSAELLSANISQHARWSAESYRESWNWKDILALTNHQSRRSNGLRVRLWPFLETDSRWCDAAGCPKSNESQQITTSAFSYKKFVISQQKNTTTLLKVRQGTCAK